MSTAFIVITIVLSIIYLSGMIFYWWGWQKLDEAFSLSDNPQTSISVIIPVRNESAHISTLLSGLQKQNYPTEQYEVIIINDHSTDDTPQQVQQHSFPNVRTFDLQSLSGKKAALHEGIQHAQGKLIVTTDGDCVHSPDWLRALATLYEREQPTMIAGPVMYEPVNNFFQKFQQVDFLGMVGVAGGGIRQSFPQVCNGANLAFEKEVFHEVGGYEDTEQTPGGDDVFLMQKIHRQFPGTIRFCKHPDAIVRTQPATSPGEFIHQRLRWGAKGKKMVDWRVSGVLLLLLLFNLMLIINTGLGFHSHLYIKLAILQWGIKLGGEGLFLYFVLRFFQEVRLLWLFLLLQIPHTVYIVGIGIGANLLSYRWETRKYHHIY